MSHLQYTRIKTTEGWIQLDTHNLHAKEENDLACAQGEKKGGHPYSSGKWLQEPSSSSKGTPHPSLVQSTTIFLQP